MRWDVKRAMLALLMLMAASFGALAGGTKQMADFKATLQAAEQGVARAQFNLGLIYRKGLGVAPHDDRARAWYQLAADQGFAEAQFNLGIMYAKGNGGQEDFVQAYKWGALSADQGLQQAAELRDLVAEDMSASQLDEAKRLVAEWKRNNTRKDGAARK